MVASRAAFLAAAKARYGTAAAAVPQEEQSWLGDVVDSAQRGVGQTFGGDLETVGQLQDVSGYDGSTAKKFGRAVSDWGDSQTQQMSQAGRDSLNQQFFIEDDEGNITAGPALTNWRSWANQGATLFGQIGAMVVGTKGAGLAVRPLARGAVKMVAKEAVEAEARTLAAKAVTKQAISNGALDEIRVAYAAAPTEQAKNAVVNAGLARLGAVGFGAHSAAMASGMRAQQARDEARDYWLKLPEEQLNADERYQKAYWDLADGELADADPYTIKHAAINSMTEQAATDAWNDPRAMASDAIAGTLEGAFAGMGGLAGKIGKTRTGAAVRGLATETAGEGWQAGETQRAVNEAIKEWADETRDPMAGVMLQALNEAVIAGPFGGMAAGIAGPASHTGPAKVTVERRSVTGDQTIDDAIHGLDQRQADRG